MKDFYRIGLYCFLVLSLCAHAHAQSANQWMQQAELFERQGIEAVQSGKYDMANEAWARALEIYRELRKPGHQARVLGNFGQLYLNTRNYVSAVSYYQKAVQLAQEFDQKQVEADLLLKLGRAYRGIPDLDAAKSAYQKSLDLWTHTDNVAGIGEAAGALGQIYQEQGDLESALKSFDLVWQTANRTGNAQLAIAASGAAGDLYYDRSHYSASIEHHSRGLEIARQVDDIEALLKFIESIGNAYYFLGNCEYAAAFHDWGYTLASSNGRITEQGSYLQNRGNAEYCLGRFDSALASYEQSQKIVLQAGDKEQVARLSGNIGRIHAHLGNHDIALKLLKQDFNYPGSDEKARSIAAGAIGDAYYFQREYQQARAFYSRSLEVANNAGYSRGAALMKTNIGAVDVLTGNWDRAETSLREGINQLNSIRQNAANYEQDQISLFEREARAYRLLQQALVENDKIKMALEVAEAGRAQILARLFNKGSTDEPDQPMSLNQILKRANQTATTIVVYSVIYDLDERASDNQRIYIWVVPPSGDIQFSETSPAAHNRDLNELVSAARRGVGARERGAIVVDGADDLQQIDALKTLYNILIRPVEDFLPGEPDDSIRFVLQDELFMVPFPALIDASGNYLIEKHTILVGSSVKTHVVKKSVHPDQSQVLIVGNPTMPYVKESLNSQPFQLDLLPGAEAEAKAIARLFNTEPISGGRATKSEILKHIPAASIVHLATHGLLDIGPSGLLQSKLAGFSGAGGAIAVAPDETDNGLWMADEIAGLKLSADLVTLSACNTGRGKITGDGVLGLSRSFLVAGAQSVLVSLWSVPDAPTADLMTRFYKSIKQGVPVPHSLRKAMLATREKFGSPLNWAGFILM